MGISLITKAAVREQLAAINDPEIGQSIVGLGLVYDVVIDADAKRLTVIFTMTSPACPLEKHFRQQITQALMHSFPSWDCQVNITFDPPWTSDKISQEVKDHLAILGMPIK